MSRKIIKTALLALLVLALGFGVWRAASFYNDNLRGFVQILRPPNQDIARLIDQRETPLILPDGYSLTIFARDLTAPRVLVQDPNGVLIVSVPKTGRVLALPDKNSDGRADEIVIVAQGLNSPHGLAFRCVQDKCRLYIAETDALRVYDYDLVSFKATDPVKLADLPGGGNHTTRSLLFLPPPNDDRLLVAIGSTCNVCHEQDGRRAKIMVIGADGGELKEYVRGLRNSVFLAVRPSTSQVWATEMGRDFLGDDLPPDEINIIEESKDYGWPICYGQNVHDAQFDKNTYIRNPCQEPFETPARIDLQAHSAPLGLAFVTGEGWSAEYADSLFVSFHGSWNRSVPTGYKVVRFRLGPNGEDLGMEDFITGWLQPDGSALGRPAGLLSESNGTLYVADDKAGVIYRVFRTK
jgi:glucose/arabinose dehydrogenase